MLTDFVEKIDMDKFEYGFDKDTRQPWKKKKKAKTARVYGQLVIPPGAKPADPVVASFPDGDKWFVANVCCADAQEWSKVSTARVTTDLFKAHSACSQWAEGDVVRDGEVVGHEYPNPAEAKDEDAGRILKPAAASKMKRPAAWKSKAETPSKKSKGETPTPSGTPKKSKVENAATPKSSPPKKSPEVLKWDREKFPDIDMVMKYAEPYNCQSESDPYGLEGNKKKC